MLTVPLTTAHVLTIAGVHASVLSIFLGIVGLYVVYHHGRRSELESQVIEAARKINRLPKPNTFSLPGSDPYDGRKAENRETLRRRLTSLAMGTPDPELPPPSDKVERGAEALRVMSAILHYYPFPQRAQPQEDGGIAYGGQTASPVSFRSVDAVRTWLDEIQELVRSVNWIWRAHRSKLMGILNSASESEKYDQRQVLSDVTDRIEGMVSEAAVEDTHRTIQAGLRPMTELFGEPFFQQIARAGNIADEVDTRVDELDAYESQRPSPWWPAASLGLAGVAFASGVIGPILDASLAPAFYVWIPVAIYFLGFLVLLTFAVRS